MKDNKQTLSPFRFAHHIQHGIPLTSEEMREFNSYLICRLYYYSGKDKICNLLNILWGIPKAFQYRLYCIFFSGFRPHGWIKSTKQKEPDKLEIEYLKRVYSISTKVATEYANLLTADEKKNIKKIFN